MAADTRLSKSTVHRIWTAFGLQPHRQRHFQLSRDPFFVEKVRDIVGLYAQPDHLAWGLRVSASRQRERHTLRSESGVRHPGHPPPESY